MISTINSLFRLAGVALVSDRFEFTSPSEANYANESGLSQHSMEDINIMRLESTKTTGTSDPETVNSAQSFDFMEPEENVAVELEKHVKRRGSKHKRRPRKGSISQKVHFGSVEVVYFDRTLGLHCVPSKGLYPLGLGNEVDRARADLESYTSAVVADLVKRAQMLGIPLPTTTDEINDSSLQTRQYDYKMGVSNKLFQSSTEDERKTLLQRSSSFSSSNLVTKEYQEFVQTTRSILGAREATGCNCKPVKVDKLSVAKLKADLVQYGYNVGFRSKTDLENFSKSELQSKLRDVLKTCHLCEVNNCECVQLEVECSAEVCGCLRGGHQTCKNPYGQAVFDPDTVHSYRAAIIANQNKGPGKDVLKCD